MSYQNTRVLLPTRVASPRQENYEAGLGTLFGPSYYNRPQLPYSNGYYGGFRASYPEGYYGAPMYAPPIYGAPIINPGYGYGYGYPYGYGYYDNPVASPLLAATAVTANLIGLATGTRYY